MKCSRASEPPFDEPMPVAGYDEVEYYSRGRSKPPRVLLLLCEAGE
jgi:hypothetical protein